MTNVADNVDVAGDGAVYVDSGSAVAPTDVDAALSGFTALGYISEDGVTSGLETSTTPIKGWQGNATIRTVVTEGTRTFQCVFLETKTEVVELYYGQEVDPVDGSIIVKPGENTPEKKMVFEYIDGDKLAREYAPKAQVTERGNVVWVNGSPVGYEVTVTCNEDATLGGASKIWYSELAS